MPSRTSRRCAVVATGVETELAFTVKYAAPETIQAFMRKEKNEVADAAVDVWALGVRNFT